MAKDMFDIWENLKVGFKLLLSNIVAQLLLIIGSFIFFALGLVHVSIFIVFFFIFLVIVIPLTIYLQGLTTRLFWGGLKK